MLKNDNFELTKQDLEQGKENVSMYNGYEKEDFDKIWYDILNGNLSAK